MSENKLEVTEVLEKFYNRNGSYHGFMSYLIKVNMFEGHFLLTYEEELDEDIQTNDEYDATKIDWYTARVVRLEDYINKDSKYLSEASYGWKGSHFLSALLRFTNKENN